MALLGSGLSSAKHHEAALSVREVLVAMKPLGADEEFMLVSKNNLANSYADLGRMEQSMQVCRDVYSGYVKLKGEEHTETLMVANNYANSLIGQERFEEAGSLLRKMMPVARRVLGDNNDMTLKMRWLSAEALYRDPSATLDDLREAVTTLEDVERTARRVLGGAHPTTRAVMCDLRSARTALRARETPEP